MFCLIAVSHLGLPIRFIAGVDLVLPRCWRKHLSQHGLFKGLELFELLSVEGNEAVEVGEELPYLLLFDKGWNFNLKIHHGSSV